MMYQWKKDEIIFVVMLKESIKYDQVKELALAEENDEHIIKDEIIKLTGEQTKTHYPENLRRVAIYNEKEKRVIEIITNNFTWPASTISELYKQRWMIEIFFKELKEHLKIKSFIGTSENAMWIQSATGGWTAMITLLLLRYLKEIAKYGCSLSNLIAFLRMNLFVKIDLTHWLDSPFKPPEEFSFDNRQENLF